MNRDGKLVCKSSFIWLLFFYLFASAKFTLGDIWMNHGGGILNHRSAIGSRQNINASSVSTLALKWRFKTGFDVSATPSIAGKMVYFPGWNGNLYALHAETGALLWERNLTQLAGTGHTLSRTTPVIYKHLLLVGLYGPSILLALNRHCGSLVWQTRPLDASPMSVITMSGTPFEGFYYVGLSSIEEFVPTCCTFQGSFQKVRLRDGHVMWKTPMLPPNSEFFGVAVWGSSPPIDKKRRLVFIGTGNTYKVPKAVEECEKKYQNNTRHDIPDPCSVEGVYEDSLLAISIDNGAVVWSRQLQGFDVWTLPCSRSQKGPNCPAILGLDFDFGEAPMLLDFEQPELLPVTSNAIDNKCLIIAGQKSGVVWALECETGKVVWSTAAGPGGSLGGTSWGASTDGERVYINMINSDGKNFTLVPSKNVTQGGGWVALEAHTGKVVWTTAEPVGAQAFGPTSVANGVLFGGSASPLGTLYALDSSSGSILWNHSTGSTIYGGFSISSQCLFGGNGYTNIPIGNPGSFFFAFCIDASLKHSSLM